MTARRPAKRDRGNDWRAALKERFFTSPIATYDDDGPSLYDHLGLTLMDGISGRSDKQAADFEKVEEARRVCREGNPFPLMALQWPSLVVDDPAEREMFRSHLQERRFASTTDTIRRVCLDPKTPVLRIDWWQRIIIAGFFDPTVSEIYVKGCTGAGKGGCTSIAINLWFDVFDESRTTLSSESFDHAIENIFGEVVKWRNRMLHPWPARVLTESVADNERHYIVVRNPRKGAGEAFSGKHGPGTLYVFDEATACPKILRDNCEKNATKIVALANPRTLHSWFRDGFEPLGRESMDVTGVCYGTIGQRLCVTVGGTDCMNVAEGRIRKAVAPRGGIDIAGERFEQGRPIPPDAFEKVKAIIPEQIDLNLFRANCAKDDPREVAIYAHGKFPDEDASKQVILSSWLQRHVDAWNEIRGAVEIEAYGLDVARSMNGDACVLSSGGSGGIREFHDFRLPNVIKIAGYVIQHAATRHQIDLRQRRHPVCVDFGGGYGSGVGDALRSEGVWVIEFHPSGSPTFPEWFANLRTEAYGLLGRRLDPQNRFGATPYPLPPHPLLAEELTAPEKVYRGDAVRFIVEPKESIKEKLRGRSPDFADSATYLFHAVRFLHQYDDAIREASQPLLMFPFPEDDQRMREVLAPRLAGENELRLDLESRIEKPAASPPDKWAALADFYKDVYGSDGSG